MTPDQVTSATLAIWLDRTSVTGLSDGDRCPTLDDLSSNAFTLSQSTNASRFIYRTNLANGLAGFQVGRRIDAFSFEPHFYPIPDLGISSGTLGSELFAVIRKRTETPEHSTATAGLIGTNSGFGFANTYPYTDNNIYDGFCTTGRHTVGNPTMALAGWHILNIQSKNSLYKLTILDGSSAEVVFSTTSSTYYDPAAAAFLGYDSRDSSGFDGWMMEEFQFVGITDSSDFDEMIAYLRGLYFIQTITSNGTGGGNWTTGATWIGGAIPITASKVVIQTGDVVNIRSAVSHGNSPSSTSDYGIEVQDGAELAIEDGGSLDCRTNVDLHSTGILNIGTSAGPGAFEFNSTGAASPTNYRVLGGEITGTSNLTTNKNTISSNTGAGGSNGHFVSTLPQNMDIFRFEDIGTNTLPVFLLDVEGEVVTGSYLVFERCGVPFQYDLSGAAMQNNDGFDFDVVSCRDEKGPKGFIMQAAADPIVTRQLNRYISEKPLDVDPTLMTITNSLLLGHGFANVNFGLNTKKFTMFRSNMVRLLDTAADIVPCGDWENYYLIADKSTLHPTLGIYTAYADIVNMHWFAALGIGSDTVFTATDGVVELFGGDDQGDTFRVNSGGGITLHVVRCLGISQNSADPGTLATFAGPGPMGFDHCTWQSAQVGALAFGELDPGTTGQLLYFTNNICFNYDPPYAGIYMIGDWVVSGDLADDLADPDDVHHNNWYGIQGAYAPTLDWSSAPGANDTNTDPLFTERRFFWMYLARLRGYTEALDPYNVPADADTVKDYNAEGLHLLRISNEPEHPDYEPGFDLLDYLSFVRAGYLPTASAVLNTASDGTHRGAIQEVIASVPTGTITVSSSTLASAKSASLTSVEVVVTAVPFVETQSVQVPAGAVTVSHVTLNTLKQASVPSSTVTVTAGDINAHSGTVINPGIVTQSSLTPDTSKAAPLPAGSVAINAGTLEGQSASTISPGVVIITSTAPDSEKEAALPPVGIIVSVPGFVEAVAEPHDRIIIAAPGRLVLEFKGEP